MSVTPAGYRPTPLDVELLLSELTELDDWELDELLLCELLDAELPLLRLDADDGLEIELVLLELMELRLLWELTELVLDDESELWELRLDAELVLDDERLDAELTLEVELLLAELGLDGELRLDAELGLDAEL